MIEINLLPEDHRKTERTPILRFLLILVFLVLTLSFGFGAAYYYKVKIPDITSRNTNIEADIASAKKTVAELDKVKKEIEDITKKKDALENLLRSRIRFGRMFDRIIEAAQIEGVWFGSFDVQRDTSTPDQGWPPAGNRYKIILKCFAVGDARDENKRKLMVRLAEFMEVRDLPKEPGKDPGSVTVEPNFGFSSLVGVRFLRPTVASEELREAPQPQSKSDKNALALVEKLNFPKQCLSFTLEMRFDLPKPKGP